jgi:uncharacterized protein (DUF362 family)
MTNLTRREFILGSVALAASVRNGLAVAADQTPDIVDVHGNNRAAMVAAALGALGGIKAFVKKGDYVVIKPNAGFANPAAWATTTHPETVVAVARACLEAGAKQVLVVDYPVHQGKNTIERCGITEALKALPEVKIKLLGGTKDFRAIDVKGAVALKKVEVAKDVLSSDILINIATAKHHGATGVSFCLKNHMGLIRDRQVFHTGLNINQALADLGMVVRPQLSILDATRALLTNGPAGPGDIAEPRRIVAGRSPASVDAYGLTLGRFGNKAMKLADTPHISLAGRAGLGETNVGKLNTKKIEV